LRILFRVGLGHQRCFFPCIASAEPDPTRAVQINQLIGSWRIVGDTELGACLAQRERLRGTELSIAVTPSDDHYQFVLRNDAWVSLTDSENFRITATFVGVNGKITDLWSLDSTSTSVEKGGPRINFSILTAKNDSANFVDQFGRANRIVFWREGAAVPVATIDLSSSGRVIAALNACRATLRLEKNYDPFAN
jgi:hypothetical protein